MSASVRVSGIRNVDGKFGKMIDLKMQCDSLGVSYPTELKEYFQGTEALEMRERSDVVKAAQEVDFKYDLKINGLFTGGVEYGDGAVVDLSLVPKDITKLRISMS